jgi:hypothetical protein
MLGSLFLARLTFSAPHVLDKGFFNTGVMEFSTGRVPTPVFHKTKLTRKSNKKSICPYLQHGELWHLCATSGADL